MKIKLPKIDVFAQKTMSLSMQAELDCAAARIWCANNPGKWMHVCIGKGRWIAFNDSGDSLIAILTHPERKYPPIDAAMMNGDIVPAERVAQDKRNF